MQLKYSFLNWIYKSRIVPLTVGFWLLGTVILSARLFFASNKKCSCEFEKKSNQVLFFLWITIVYSIIVIYLHTCHLLTSQVAWVVKEPACQCRRHKRCGFDPWVGKIPWRRTWQPTPVFLPGESPWREGLGGLQSIGSPGVGHA